MPAARRRIPLTLAILLLALGTAATATPLPGQDSTAVAGSEWRFGGSIGLPGFGREPFVPAFTLGMHLTWMPAGPMGVDLSVGTAPFVLLQGELIVGARGALTLPIRRGSVVILPGAGVSYLGAGAIDPDGLMGGHIGAAVIGGEGMRMGLTLHWLGGESLPVWLFEVGVQPARRR